MHQCAVAQARTRLPRWSPSSLEFTFLVLFATGTTQSYGVARKEYFRRFPRLLGRERADASAGAWVPRAQVEQADAAYVHLRSTASIAEEDDVYEVEAVLDARRARKGGMEYLIQWKGYDATASTWESATNVSDALIAQYHGAQGSIGDADIGPRVCLSAFAPARSPAFVRLR